MSTLKKILSLSLALAMLMSVSVFAGFADEATIDADAKAAVELLTAVKILNGIEKEDGTFDFAPTATIKRAEAAKMIYVLRNGGVDDKAETWKGVVSFADCKDHWAAGYIAYCEAYGLINGRTETVFDPEAPVTGVELAKMLLTTAGYKTDAEGFTGNGWEKNVVAEANAVELFKGVEFAISDAAPRQWAAVMFQNAFKVKVPTYIGDYRVDGILTGVTSQTVQAKFLNFDDSEVTYVLATATAAMPGQAKAEAGKTVLASGTVDFVVADALVGQQVKVTKITKNNVAKIVSIAATGETVMGKLTIGAQVASTAAQHAGEYPIYIDGALWGYRAGTANLTITNVDAGVGSIADTETKTVAELKAAIEAKTTAYTVYGYDKDGNNAALEAAIAVTTEYGAVTVASDKSFTVGNFAVDKDGKNGGVAVTIEGTMKTGIVAKVTKDMFTGKITVAPADIVMGAFTGVDSTGAKFTVGGATYEYSAKYIENTFLSEESLKTLVKDTVVLYTDGKYIVKAVKFEAETVTPDTDPTELPSKLAMLIEAKEVTTSATSTDEWGTVTNTPTTVTKVQVLLADGTTVILPYETASAIVVDANHITAAEVLTAAVGDVFEYTITANGKILFKQALPTVDGINYYTTAGAQGAAVTFDTAKKMLNGIANEFIMATDNTKVFVKYINDEPGKTAKTEYKVMKMADLVAYEHNGTGDVIKLIAATDAKIAEALLATAVVSYKAPTAPQATPVDHYVISTSGVEYKVVDGKIFAVFTAIDLKNNCATKTFESRVYTESADLAKNVDLSKVAKNTILKIKTADDLVTEAKDETWTPAAITAKAGNLILVNGTDIWQTSGEATKFASGCKVIAKNGDAYTVVTVDNLTVAKFVTGSTTEYQQNVQYVLGTGTNAEKVAYIIIDMAKTK